jgi:hypothetical protein
MSVVTSTDEELAPLAGDAQQALEDFARAEPAPPPAARVRGEVQRSVRRRRVVRRIAVAAGGAAGVVAAALLALSVPFGSTRPSSAGPLERAEAATVVAAASTSQARRPVGAGDRLESGRVVVGKTGHLELRLATADAAVDGPAQIVLGAQRIEIGTGRGHVRGRVQLDGCGCSADVNGEARFEAFTRYLQVVVVAGTVEVRGPDTACRIIDLEPPPSGDVDSSSRADLVLDELAVDELAVDELAVDSEPRPSTRVAPRRASRCDLGEQAEAYRAAMRFRGSNEAALLVELRQIRRQWPRCPLSHEVDLAVIDTLLRAGREDDARREARSFLRRYPNSARRSAIEPIASTR